MSNRKKFKIMFPDDYPEEQFRGLQYKPREDHMVVMNNQGVFFLVCLEPYNYHITKLSNVLPKYDVVWK